VPVLRLDPPQAVTSLDYSDPDVCRIAAKMLSIHYIVLVGVNNFAEFRENLLVTV